jgi:thymidylate synthase (FAD)
MLKAEYISHMGSDLTVVDSARVSFNKSSDFADDGMLMNSDCKLVAYLAKHNHWTPFSHPQITLRYTIPLFVARQEFKHIVGFTRNEVSRRYVNDTPEFYTPEVWRRKPDGNIKQGSGDDIFYDHDLKRKYDDLMREAGILYEKFIAFGVAPEQARMMLPQSMTTSYYITGSLAAFSRFFKQRTEPNAQLEIQELAKQVGAIIAPLYPVSWRALNA